ncbi:predicted protein [Chaetoceros tenuissimus]|uniref:Uncharacterized protein n=1 Tax=Chaetoceros tenuissimus TaxID=426638 RepID=A0AAD3HB88_9STRA|nr:predicted protein [Chaetoceros tenuissimus]
MKPTSSSSKHSTAGGDTDSFFTPVASGTETGGGTGDTANFFTAVASSTRNENVDTSRRDSTSSTSSASVASSGESGNAEPSLGDSTPAVADTAHESEFLLRREPETPAVERDVSETPEAPVERALRVSPELPKEYQTKVEFLTRRSPNVDIIEDDSGEDDSSKCNTSFETPVRRSCNIRVTPVNNMLAAMNLNEGCKCDKQNSCTDCIKH